MKADNVKPIFNTSGDYFETLYANEGYIGCELRIYADDDYETVTLLVDGPQGETWNETYGVYTTWTGGSTNGWITKTRYVFLPEDSESVFFHIVNYGLANLSVSKMFFGPTECNCNENFPVFEKNGSIDFINISGKDEFLIGYYGAPHGTGESVSVEELNKTGVNVIIKISGYHDDRSWDPNFYFFYSPDDLEEYNMYGSNSIYAGGYRSEGEYIFNKSQIPLDSSFLGRNRSFLYNYEKHPNFFGYWSDEPNCHGEGFLPELREWNWMKQRFYDALFIQEGKAPAVSYIDLCGGNQDDDEMVESWIKLADVMSFTQNFLDFGPDAKGSSRLDDVGGIVRRLKNVSHDKLNKNVSFWALPSVEMSWAGEKWKDQNSINITLTRFQIYNQIANGASGVHWFPMNMLDLNLASDNLTYNRVLGINSELVQLRPVLNEKQFYDVWDSSQYLEIMAKQHNGKWYLIATNPSYLSKPDTMISLNGIGEITSLKARFEDSFGAYNNSQNRTMIFQNTRFFDDFGPYDAHIYEIETELPSTQCQNGIDDDVDNLTDFPDDPGCESEADDAEWDDNESWWDWKAITAFDGGIQAQYAVENFTSYLHKAAGYGFNVVQIYDPGYAKVVLNKSNLAGATLRDYKMKVLVPIFTHGGALAYPINSTVTSFSFMAAGWWQFSSFASYYYYNSSNKTFWLDDECIKFDSITNKTEVFQGQNVMNFTIHGAVRGYCGTNASAHQAGVLPVNAEYTTMLMRSYTSPEMFDAVAGYYAIDDSPVFNIEVDYRGMQKKKEEIIRSIDPNLSRPILYGHMAYLPDTWWLTPGTTNYTHIDGLLYYVYPWRYYANLTNIMVLGISQMRQHEQEAGKNIFILPAAQVYYDDSEYRSPTEKELHDEIVLWRALGIKSMSFYEWRRLLKNSYDYEHGVGTEYWKEVIRGMPLGNLTAAIDAKPISNDEIIFNALGSTPGHGPILNYTWDFGDGSTGEGEIISHRYSVGTYVVILNISNSAIPESRTNELIVTISENQEPCVGCGGGGGSGGSGLRWSGGVSCVPNWQCVWGECVENLQRMSCSDENACNITEGKPIEGTKVCGLNNNTEENLTEMENPDEEGNKDNSILWTVSGLGILFFLVLAGAIFAGLKKDKANFDLRNFVDESRRRGYSDSEIHSMLKNNGWSDKELRCVIWVREDL